ncbi:alkaline phosphatase [Actinoplanes sp. SE50]|uniref:response regulator transcription factor n=1 Tax=unclassified Actinoplanes TaxID=2626549 RepID=UPI00023EC471|nr:MULTISPECIES: response regulator transcription factor [unclassified Actinoplanes]AEV84636.1 Transcriptional regulatory protein yycF [Actinoplanes sp. SE50/110]ATO83028.1 alkaline phosphatase [Actinoplanes sp. SE50]SLM00436.1 two component transcriptional regulator, winged helix family [Actinoplanes sp. SE50/110]
MTTPNPADPRQAGGLRPRTAGLVALRPARVLVVDDEAPIAEVLTAMLSFAGFEVRAAASCAQARALAAEFRPELAVLDIMLPDGSGLDLCLELRARDEQLAVLLLSARDSIEDRVAGLTLGADDYVIKPFSTAEVVARLNVLLRRTAGAAPTTARRVGDLELDEQTHRVVRAGRVITLSPTEFRLLRYLMRHVELVLSRRQILREVWGYEWGGDAAVVEKFISQLRGKIDADGAVPLLHTVRGFGYAIREPVA